MTAASNPPAGPFPVAVVGAGRAAAFWRDELTDDPRFVLAESNGAATRLVVPPLTAEPRPGDLVLRPGRFAAAFATAKSAADRLGGPIAATLCEQTPLPLPTGDPARDAEHGSASDRLESRLDELLALTGWTAPTVTFADRRERGEEVTLRVCLEEPAGGSAWIEIVRGAAGLWEPGWALRSPAGGYAAGTLETREPAGELAPRPWPPEPVRDVSPLEALHAHLAGGPPWPITAAQTATARALTGKIRGI